MQRRMDTHETSDHVYVVKNTLFSTVVFLGSLERRQLEASIRDGVELSFACHLLQHLIANLAE
jgi:hypothetical protein